MRLQLFKANELKRVRVRRFQVHRQRNAGLQCFQRVTLSLSPPLGLCKAAKAALKTRLNSLTVPLRSVGVPVNPLAVVGFLLDEILRQSAKYHADCIILGSRGHNGAHHLVTGKVFTGKEQLTCPMMEKGRGAP